MEFKVTDRVILPLGETGTIVKINDKILWGFKYVVRIRKAVFNKTNERHDFKVEQLSYELD
jgi:hypothetical protein